MAAEGNDISCNQEGMYTHDEEMNFKLDITRPSEGDGNAILENKYEEIIQLMRERHELAKCRESLCHGSRTNRHPSWLYLRLNCSFKLNNEADNQKLAEQFENSSRDAISNLVQGIISYLEEEINIKENSMQAARSEGFKAFGPATKGWVNAKKEFDIRLTDSKKEYNEKLRLFKNGLLSSGDNNNQMFDSIRGRGQKHYRGRRGHRGVRGNRGYFRGTPY